MTKNSKPQDEKPQEFWIHWHDEKQYASSEWLPPGTCVHVIEYSAYEKAMAEYQISTADWIQADKELQAQRQRNEKLVEALRECVVELKKYDVSGLDKFGGHTKIKITNANKALAEHQGSNGNEGE